MRFDPMNNNVFVERMANVTIDGGIHIPDKFTPTTQQALVIAVGDKCRWVRPNDEILIAKMGGQDVTLEGRKYFIIPESDVLCIKRGE